ncbi:organic solute transporter subunit beta [Spea bombifrons]|uniref:organic solute transporter subunit beta n=1 Tax=Spea bombifrons TaxID=233779 RepID=UPI0023498A3A|nr:organic solute transporter subunit beta [Spea bombifrons]XP_053321549.1 organic solute transporter subunit beta [Spea bombifrons]
MGDSSTIVETTPSVQQKKMEKALWFFRTGDLTAWNYAILALAFVALFLGIFVLVRSIFNNRKKKMIALYQKNANAALSVEADGKQAVVHLEKDTASQEDNLLKKEPQPGDITVQWKDGQITSLYTEVPEEDV